MVSRRTAQQIVDDVAEGAARLFLERSPSAVSVREIAAEAAVNLGLIHRYVGSKEDIIALVLERHTAQSRAVLASVSGADDALDAVAEAIVGRPATGKLMAGLILDGVDVAGLKGDFPLLDLLSEDHQPVDAAITYALALGWEVFGPSLLSASGADVDDDALSMKLAVALKALSVAPLPPSC